MAEGALASPTLRLLEPRALAGADRLAARLTTPPLSGVQRRGAAAFSDRIVRSWIGGLDEHPLSAVSRYEPPSAPRVVPRVALPVVALDPIAELRAIDVVRAAAPVAAVRLPVGASRTSPPLTQRLVEQLGRADQMLRLVPTAAAPAVEVAPVVGSSYAQMGRGQEALVARSFVAPEPTLRATAVTPAGAAPRPAAPVVAPSVPVEPVVASAPRAAPVVGPSATAATLAAFAAELAASMTTPQVTAPVIVAPLAASTSSVPSSDAARSVSASFLGRDVPAASRDSRPRAEASSTMPALSLRTEMTPGLPMVWPRLSRFIERLAGPVLLEQTGAVSVDALTSAAAERASSLSLLQLPDALPRRGATQGPVDRYVRVEQNARVTPTLTTLVPAAPSAPGRALVAQLERAVSPPAEATAVAEAARASNAVRAADVVAPVARTTDAVFATDSVRAVDARELDSTRSTGTDAPTTSSVTGPAASSTLSSEVSTRVREASFTGDGMATLVGELLHYPTAGGRYLPGRLAQRAELMATLAEQRADRQLGLEQGVSQRSVRWSSDAFTVVSLDPWTSSPIGVTGAARVGASMSPRPGMDLVSPSSPLATEGTRPFMGSTPPATRELADANVLRRPGFDAAFVVPERWITARGVEHALPRRDAGVPASYSDTASRAAALGVAIAPASIAALLAFADAQLGPRLLEAARPLPVAPPGVVYVSPEADEVAARGTNAAERPGQRDFARRLVELPTAPTFTVGFDSSSDFSLAAAVGERGGARSDRAITAEPQSHGATGQLARRTEQAAGELGVRVGALASEFLIDVPTDGVPGDQGTTLHAREAGRGWLSTSEWILLSLFPSTSMAHEIAAGSALGDRPSRFPLAALLGPAGVVGRAEPAHGGLRARTALGETGSGGLLGAFAASDPVALDSLGSLSERAPPRPTLTGSLDPFGPYASNPSGASASPTTAFLPDGRLPRGNRMVPRAGMPTVGGAPTSVVNTSDAAERRAAAPVGAPLWGHLRPLVDPSSGARASSSAAPGRPVVPALASLQGAQSGPRSAALELVAPFIEASRAETTGGAASFNRPASPVVSARAPDQSTKSLVSALSAAGSQPSNDRLSMADLTLISIVSATEQVAASSAGATPDIAPADGRRKPGSSHTSGSSFGRDEDREVEIVADRAYERLMDEARRYNENKGGTWEV